MCKLKKSKGFGLAEVINSLSIIFLLIVSVYKVETINFKLDIYNRKMNNYIEALEGVKNDIVYNNEYREMKDILGDNKIKKLYIDEKDLNLDNLKNKRFTQICHESVNEKCPCLEIVLQEEEDNVMKIDLIMITKSQDKGMDIKTSFYKGDY